MTEVVKLQVPRAGPGGPRTDGPTLVYDNRRGRCQFIEVLPEPVESALGRDLKAYFNATWSDAGWTLLDRVADQKW
jgi:hypothetical protein